MPAKHRASGVLFHSLMFIDNHLELSYQEEADYSGPIQKVQTIIVPSPEFVPVEWADLIHAIFALREAAERAGLNIPDTISSA